ncbi:MAG: DnaD [Bacteriophage sp.]|nr:MAG: DnaD [Bacteriophage sp.]
MKSSILITRKYFEAISQLPKENQSEVWNAVFDYALNDISPTNLNPISQMAFTFIATQIDGKFKNPKPTSDPIEQRRKKFAEELSPYIQKYGRDLLNEFYKYWAEPNQSKTRFKKEMQETWDLEGRLETWAKRNNSFAKPNGAIPKIDTSQNTYIATKDEPWK